MQPSIGVALSVASGWSVSVSPSVWHMPLIVSKQESRRNFTFSGNVALDKST